MMYGYDATGSSGWWMVLGMLIVALTVLGSVWLMIHRTNAGGVRPPSAEDILQEHFPRGELTTEQFSEERAKLG